jgi:hypothetical protein
MISKLNGRYGHVKITTLSQDKFEVRWKMIVMIIMSMSVG